MNLTEPDGLLGTTVSFEWTLTLLFLLDIFANRRKSIIVYAMCDFSYIVLTYMFLCCCVCVYTYTHSLRDGDWGLVQTQTGNDLWGGGNFFFFLRCGGGGN